MENKKDSYTAASNIPLKVLLNKDIFDKQKRIKPYHIQLNPTNVCNLNCPMCSCANRNKTEEMTFDDIAELMVDAKDMGCKSVTITGGGEPLLHKKINEIIRFIGIHGIKIGLVTNGTQFDKLKDDVYQYITWCRISSTDHRKFAWDYAESLHNAVEMGLSVDWAFSHVLSQSPNYECLVKLIRFANSHNFTHVRIVSNLLDLENMPPMKSVKTNLKRLGLEDDSIVIYQGRKDYDIGTKRCLISLLKPVIGADGYIYPCCGVQYALENPGLDYEKTMRMGHWRDLKKIYEKQQYFDGRICVKCYYDSYNVVLNAMSKEINHREFV